MNSVQVIPEPAIKAPYAELNIQKVPDFVPGNQVAPLQTPALVMNKAPEPVVKTVSEQAVQREALFAKQQQTQLFSESLRYLENIHYLRIEEPKVKQSNLMLMVSNYAGFQIYAIKQVAESFLLLNTVNHEVMKIRKSKRMIGDEWAVHAPENNPIGYFKRNSLFTKTDWRIQDKRRVDVMKFELDTCFTMCSCCCSSLAEDYKIELIGPDKNEMGKFHDESKKEPKKVNQVEMWRKHHVIQFAEGIQLEQKMMILASAIIVYANNFMKHDNNDN